MLWYSSLAEHANQTGQEIVQKIHSGMRVSLGYGHLGAAPKPTDVTAGHSENAEHTEGHCDIDATTNCMGCAWRVTPCPWTDQSPCTPRLLEATLTVGGN